jgi:hypothetical protein
METWMAVKKGLTVRVFFPSLDPAAAMRGEYLRLLVEEVGVITGKNSEFVGKVLDHPTANVGAKVGQKINLPVSRVDEVLP